jgi:hypothetical protein
VDHEEDRAPTGRGLGRVALVISRRIWTAVLLAGLAAGVGDTLLAMGMYRVGPAPVYRAVASGLVGRDAAVRGGLVTAALGMLLHFRARGAPLLGSDSHGG